MENVRVTCENRKEVIEVLKIAKKEGYRWSYNGDPLGYMPDAECPYDIAFSKTLLWGVTDKDEKPYTAQDFINEYNIDHAETFGISQKVKNEIIMDFIKKWREIRMGCAGRSCMNCKFLKDVVDGAYCQLDDVGNTDNARFLAAAKILFDVVASGDPHIRKLTPDEAIEVLEEEIKASKDTKDAEAQKRVAALKMAMRALEEKENGFRAKGD